MYSTRAPRDDLEVPDPRPRLRPAVSLDERDDDVDAARTHRVRVVEHLVRLPDARRLPDVDLQVPALGIALGELEKLLGIRAITCGARRHALIMRWRAALERRCGGRGGRRRRDLRMAEPRVDLEVQSEDVDAALAVEAEKPTRRVRSDDCLEIGSGNPGLAGDAGNLQARVFREMWGSTPEADDVTASAGTAPVAPSSLLTAVTASLTESASFLEVGPRFVPPDAVGS